MKNIFSWLTLVLTFQFLTGAVESNKALAADNQQIKIFWQNFEEAKNKKDGKEAIAWLRKGTQLGDLNSMYMLAVYLDYGVDGADKDIKEAFSIYNKCAEKGHPNCQSHLGLLYRNPTSEQKSVLGIEQSCEKSLRWFQKAKSDGQGAYYQGMHYEHGCEGKYVDLKKARLFYEKSMKVGNVPDAKPSMERVDQKILENKFAATDAGKRKIYWEKFGAAQEKKDGKEAIEWLRKGAALGDRRAVESLAAYLEFGIFESEKNLKEAYKYYRKAAEMGHTFSQIKMSQIYLNPSDQEKTLLGVKQDCKKALSWLQKSKNDGQGAHYLGRFYEDGCGGKYVDYKKARDLFQTSLKLGVMSDAQSHLDRIEQKIAAKKNGKSESTKKSAGSSSFAEVLKSIDGAEFRPGSDVHSNYRDLWMSVSGDYLTVHNYDDEEEEEWTEIAKLTDFNFEVKNYASCTNIIPVVNVRLPPCAAKSTLSSDGKTITFYPVGVQWDHKAGKGVFFKKFNYYTIVLTRTK